MINWLMCSDARIRIRELIVSIRDSVMGFIKDKIYHVSILKDYK
jgi:hypothetical protein